MWTHLVAIACLAALCSVWVLVQRASGDERTHSGGCGACTQPEPEACEGRGECGRGGQEPS